MPTLEEQIQRLSFKENISPKEFPIKKTILKRFRDREIGRRRTISLILKDLKSI